MKITVEYDCGEYNNLGILSEKLNGSWRTFSILEHSPNAEGRLSRWAIDFTIDVESKFVFKLIMVNQYNEIVLWESNLREVVFHEAEQEVIVEEPFEGTDTVWCNPESGSVLIITTNILRESIHLEGLASVQDVALRMQIIDPATGGSHHIYSNEITSFFSPFLGWDECSHVHAANLNGYGGKLDRDIAVYVGKLDKARWKDSFVRITGYNKFTEIELFHSSFVLSGLTATKQDVTLSLTRHDNYLGTLNLNVMIVHPYERENNHLGSNLKRKTWEFDNGVIVGHRGLGKSFTCKPHLKPIFQENSIVSMKVLNKGGINFVEFDVHLTKDRVPVVYHDFDVILEVNNQEESTEGVLVTSDVHDLTYDELVKAKKYHATHQKKRPALKDTICKYWGTIHEKPPGRPMKKFSADNGKRILGVVPRLEDLFRDLPVELGFNIELKYPVLDEELRYESLMHFDCNKFVDDILDVVFKYMDQQRNIVFSCFNADICILLQMKQAYYKVFMLTASTTYKGPDIRTQSLDACVSTAKCWNLHGVVSEFTPLAKHPGLIKLIRNNGLKILTYGNNSTTVNDVKTQIDNGISGVICDNAIYIKEWLKQVHNE